MRHLQGQGLDGSPPTTLSPSREGASRRSGDSREMREVPLQVGPWRYQEVTFLTGGSSMGFRGALAGPAPLSRGVSSGHSGPCRGQREACRHTGSGTPGPWRRGSCRQEAGGNTALGAPHPPCRKGRVAPSRPGHLARPGGWVSRWDWARLPVSQTSAQAPGPPSGARGDLRWETKSQCTASAGRG